MPLEKIDNILHSYKERSFPHILPLIFPILSAGLGLFVVIVWVAGFPQLAAFDAGRIPMAPSTALLFLIYGTIVFLYARFPLNSRLNRISLVLGWAGIFIGLPLIILALRGIRSPIEHFGFNIAGTVDGSSIGHMSPLTAICFAFAGLSFLALLSASSKRRWQFIESFCLASAITLISIVMIMAYILGKPLLYGTGIIPPSLPTSMAFLMLGTAILMLSYRQAWPHDDQRETTGTRTKYIYALTFIMLAAGLTTVGYLYLRNFERQYRAETEQTLTSIASMKVRALVDWKTDYLKDGEILFKNISFQALVRRYLENPKDADAQRQLQIVMGTYSDNFHFDKVRLIDRQGVTRMSIPDKRTPTSLVIKGYIPEVLRSPQVTFVDFYFCDDCQKIHMAVLVPILNDQDGISPLAILQMRINPTVIFFPLVQLWPVPSQSGEALIIRRDGNNALILNELKFQQGTALKLRVPLADNKNLPAVKAALGQEGIVEGNDYRGVPVLAYVCAVPNSPWFLVAKMDISEVYAPVRNRMWMTLGLVVFLLLGMGMSLRLVWRQRRMQYYRDKYKAEEELSKNKQLLQAMMDATTDAIYIKDLHGRYMLFNAAAERAVGKKAAEVIGKDDTFIFPPKEAIVVMEGDRKVMEGRSTQTYEEFVTDGTGGHVTYLSTKGPLLDANGKTIGLFGIARDITERKQNENRRQLLTNILRVLNETVQVSTMIENILNAIKSETGFDAIGMRLQNGDDFPYYAQDGFPGDFLSTENMLIIRDKDKNVCRDKDGNISLACTCGLVLCGKTDPANSLFTPGGSCWTNDSLQILDIPANKDPRLNPRNRCIHEGYNSVALIPIRARGKIIGLLHLNNRKPNSFTLDMIGFFEEVCGNIGMALSQRQAAESLQESEERLRQTLDASNVIAWEISAIDKTHHEAGPVDRIFGKPSGFRHAEVEELFASIHPDDREKVASAIEKALRGEGPYSMEYRVPQEDGSIRWLSANGTLEKDANGCPLRLLGVAHDITYQKLNKLALEESEERFRTVIENTGEGIGIVDLEERFIFVNRAAEKIFGMPEGGLVGHSLREFINDSQFEDIGRKIKDRSTGQDTSYQLEITHKDGTACDIIVTSTTRYDASANPIGSFGVFRDITKLKRAEEALKTSEERYRTVANYTFDWEYWMTPDGGLNYISPSCQNITGYKAEEFQKDPSLLTAIVHPDDRDSFAEHIEHIHTNKCDEKFEMDFRILTRNGDERWIAHACRKVFSKDGYYLGRRASNRDITERVKIQEALRYERNKNQRYLDTVETIIVALDTEGKISAINRKGRQLLGYREDELVGQLWFSACLPRPDGIETVYPYFLKLISGEIEAEEYFENSVLTRSGELRQIAWHNAVLRDEQGRINGVLSSGEDITEHKLAEKALRESEVKFASIFETVSDIIFLIAVENNRYQFKSVNNAFVKLTGLPIEAVENKYIDEIIPEPSLSTVVLKNYDKAIAERKIVQWEEVSQYPTGMLIGIVSISPLFNESGICTHLVGSVHDITQRKQAEDALQESEYFFKESQRAGFIGSYKTDFKAGFWESSEVLDQIFGIDEHYIRSVENWLEIVHPEDRESLDRYLREVVISERKPFDKEYRIIRKSDGEIRWVLGLGKVGFDIEGNIISMIGTIQDITDRVKTGEALRASEEKFRALTENAPMAIYMIDTFGNCIYANRKWLLHAGLTMEEAIGQGWLNGLHEDDRAIIGENWYKAVASNGDWGFEYRFVNKDKKVTWVYGTAVAISNTKHETIGYVGTNIDISKLVRAEADIREAELKYRIIADNTYDWEFWQAPTGEFLYVSPSCKRVTGYEASEFIKDTGLLQRIIHPDDISTWERHENAVKTGNMESPVSFRILCSDSSERWIEHLCQPVFDNKGNFIGTRGSNRDITETKRLQESVSRAQRLETAGRIAGQVAHDFNNLLGPMIAYPDMIREELPAGHPILPYIDDIENAAQQIADINQQLLTLGRRGHYNHEIVNLNQIVRQAVHDLGQLPATLVCNMELAENLFNTRGGSAQLHRVISNLLHNAVDAIRDIGEITIKTSNYYVDEVSIVYGRVPRGEYVKLTISDTGCGIPDDIVQKIFDPFFTTKATDKKRGSGLGMSVVDAVIKDHNGYIDLHTKVGKGTSFYVYLPISREAIGDQEKMAIIGGNERILVIDDDDLQREVSKQMLMKMGYAVSTAESGEKALEMLQSYPQDLLVLDMIMPPGIDGTETYRCVLEINPYQKAILVSGFAESDRVFEAQKLGVGAFVRKPLSRATLAAAVRTELDRNKLVPIA